MKSFEVGLTWFFCFVGWMDGWMEEVIRFGEGVGEGLGI